MRQNKISIALILLVGILFTGFQCSSTEVTSAKLYIQQKNYDKALAELDKETSKNPQNEEAFYLKAVVYYETDQFEKMADAADKALAINQNHAKELKDMKYNAWVKSFNQGASLFKKGVDSQNEDSSKVYFDKSAVSFETAIALLPDSVDAYKNLAFVYISQNQYDKAVVPLQSLIDKRKAAEGYRLLGDIYYTMGTQLKDENNAESKEYYDKAIALLEEGRDQHPNDQEILLTLSNSYIGANRIEEALDAFKTGVEKDPGNKFYRYNYGVLLLGAENYEAAEEQFRKAVEIDGEYANALYNLAVTYVKWGTSINQQAEEKGEMNNQAYKEKYQLALPHLEKVTELKPEDAPTWELLGKVYTVLGMQEKATEAFNKADQYR